jgi:hypothetical protein
MTPSPTSTQVPIPLDIKRQQIQDVFKSLGFAFYEVSPIEGQPRWIGKSIDKTAALELLGTPLALTRVTITTGESYVGDQSLVNRVYMSRCIKIIAPNWKEGNDWLDRSLSNAYNTQEPEMTLSTTYNDLTITLTLMKSENINSLMFQKTTP